MVLTQLERALGVLGPSDDGTGTARERPGRAPWPAVVVRSDGQGVFVAALPVGDGDVVDPAYGGDRRHPVGPCRAATEQVWDVATSRTVARRFAVGRRLLIILAADGPWVLAADG